jgi:peptidyl-prolyl cis-trans isomerase C
MTSASARHILVSDEATCKRLKSEIEAGADFGDVARRHSTCPSAASGGELGTFRPGEMVPEFDKVVFSAEVGQVHGPVRTQFGWHLIEISRRAP